MTATASRPNASDSAGFLVLGMHRSGTSVLARLLAAAGANPGERLVPGSLGNEEGHWEDAFAVETNERLLSALGHRWDDLRPLPRDWMRSDAASVARAQIRGYLRSSLSKHSLWAIKDPRMCLFAELWLGALAEEGCTPSVLLLARHPQEIAGSLAVRDGMADGKALLLWLRHALDAERATRGLPRAFIGYDELLADPAGVMRRISRLPGGERLRETPGGSVDGGIVRQERRHHRHDGAPLPEPVGLAWRAHLAAVAGDDDSRAFDEADSTLARADSLFAPVLQELDREREVLWERTARAEAELAKTTNSLVDVPATLEAHHGQSIEAITSLTRLINTRMAALQHGGSPAFRLVAASARKLVVAGHAAVPSAQAAGRRSARSERQKLVAMLAGREANRPIEVTARSSENSTRSRLSLAAANPERPDVFVWAVIDWHFRTQRPQHLASALAGAGHRVFYLSNNLADSATPGFRIEPLDASGRLFQVNLHAPGAPEIYYGARAADHRRPAA